MLPFSHAQFVQVFVDYNRAVWPAAWVAYAIGLVVALACRPAAGPPAWRTAWIGLALMWAWTGVAYHGVFFARINPAARSFAWLFALQAALSLVQALWPAGQTRPSSARRRAAGWGLLVYAAIAYPLAGQLAGPGYPALPLFGITPCPVVLWTWGVMLLGPQPISRHLLVVPALWGLVGGSAAVLLQVPQDWPLLLGSAIVTPLLWRRADQDACVALPGRTQA